MPTRGAHAAARQGRVQPALVNGLFDLRICQRFFSAIMRLLDKLPGPVEPLPGRWPLGGGQAAQLFELLREPAFPAQIIDPGLLKPGQAGRGPDRREGLGLELFDVVQSCSPGRRGLLRLSGGCKYGVRALGRLAAGLPFSRGALGAGRAG